MFYNVPRFPGFLLFHHLKEREVLAHFFKAVFISSTRTHTSKKVQRSKASLKSSKKACKKA
jgi:hypothetical protein